MTICKTYLAISALGIVFILNIMPSMADPGTASSAKENSITNCRMQNCDSNGSRDCILAQDEYSRCRIAEDLERERNRNEYTRTELTTKHAAELEALKKKEEAEDLLRDGGYVRRPTPDDNGNFSYYGPRANNGNNKPKR